MPSITAVTIQSAILKVAANLTAQTLAKWNNDSDFEYDWIRVAEFAVFGIISAPIVSIWQRLLEQNYPSQRQSSIETRNGAPDRGSSKSNAKVASPTKQLNWRNIVIKLLLDQTIGQFIINTTFLICTNGARIQSWQALFDLIQARIFVVIWASWKLWPWVALVNFIWVPVQWSQTLPAHAVNRERSSGPTATVHRAR